MTWSTRQLADLTGVTLRSIRHWHDIGLLPEPERLSNGYKQYTARHLVLALRIARLAGLGFTLEQVAEALDSEAEGQRSLRVLRTEVESRIVELTRIRDRVDELLSLGVAPGLSPEALLAMEALGDDPGSRNVAIMLAHLIPAEGVISLVTALREAPGDLAEVDGELRRLPAEATQHDIESLVERTVAVVEEFLARTEHELPSIDAIDQNAGADAMVTLVSGHMNSAQHRAMTLLIERLTDRAGSHIDASDGV